MTFLDSAELRESLANAKAAVSIFDAQRRFLWVNDRFLELTGFPRDEIDAFRAGEHLRLEPLDQNEFMKLVTSAISAGEADIVRMNGEPLAVEYVVIPTRIGDEPAYVGMRRPSPSVRRRGVGLQPCSFRSSVSGARGEAR
jgi:PAS domain S-box-containing protein